MKRWLVIVLLTGCAPLKPWERGEIVARCMQATGDPLEAAMDQHVHATRESARGAAGAEGASCGCN